MSEAYDEGAIARYGLTTYEGDKGQMQGGLCVHHINETLQATTVVCSRNLRWVAIIQEAWHGGDDVQYSVPHWKAEVEILILLPVPSSVVVGVLVLLAS